MEHIIKNNSDKYYIFRLPQVVGKTTSDTLVDFLYNKIINDEEFIVYQHSTRNLIDTKTIKRFVDKFIMDKKYINHTINIATPFNIKIIDIVKKIEFITNKQAKYILKDYGASFDIDISIIQKFDFFDEVFRDNYIDNILISFFKEYYE